MFRASDILRNARLDKELELLEISKKLKIPVKYLKAIESEDHKSFPQEPYLSLMVKDYANYLQLNGPETLSIFRRDYEQKKNITNNQSQKISFTPQLTFKILITLSVLIFSFYLVSEYLKFNRPPPLDVDWPNISTLQDDTLEVSGKTDPESTVRINNDLVIVNSDGSFSKRVYVNQSRQSTITVEATSPAGKSFQLEKSY